MQGGFHRLATIVRAAGNFSFDEDEVPSLRVLAYDGQDLAIVIFNLNRTLP